MSSVAGKGAHSIQDRNQKMVMLEKALDTFFRKKFVTTDLSGLLKFYNIVFKGLDRRDEQIQYMLMCYEGMVNRIPVVIEGPTGLGKTRALIGSFMPLLHKNNYRVVYCSRTINQLIQVLKELKEVLAKEKNKLSEISAVLYIGLDNCRATVCNRENCEGCEKRGRIKNFTDHEYASLFLDAKELKTRVYDEGYCPYATCRFEACRKTKVVACTYTYLLSEMERRRISDTANKENIILIVDEAHSFIESISEDPYVSIYVSETYTGPETELNNNTEKRYFVPQLLDLLKDGIKAELRQTFEPHLHSLFEEVTRCKEQLEDLRRVQTSNIAFREQAKEEMRRCRQERERCLESRNLYRSLRSWELANYYHEQHDLYHQEYLRYKGEHDYYHELVEKASEEYVRIRAEIGRIYDAVNRLKNDLDGLTTFFSDTFNIMTFPKKMPNFESRHTSRILESLKDFLLRKKASATLLYDLNAALVDNIRIIHSRGHDILYGDGLYGFLDDLTRRFVEKQRRELESLRDDYSKAVIQRDYEYLAQNSELFHLYEVLNALARSRSWNFYLKFIDTERGILGLEIFAIAPREWMTDILSNFHSVVLTSGTLSPPERIAMLLGVDSGISQRLDPIFKNENYLSFVVLGFNSGQKETFTKGASVRFEDFERKLMRDVIDRTLAPEKNSGIFASSEDVLQDLYADIVQVCRKKNRRFIVGDERYLRDDQKRTDDFEYLKEELQRRHKISSDKSIKRLELFKEAGKEKSFRGIVLIGITGGMFAEGLDFPGSEMEIGIIIGIPYRDWGQEQLLNKVKTDYFYMMTGDKSLAECLAYRYNAIRKMAQTAGRIHRSETDRGVIVFIDERMVGLKNHRDVTGETRYEFLSRKNVKESWAVIQKPIFETMKITTPSHEHKPFADYEDDILSYLKELLQYLKMSSDRIIDLNAMSREIMDFFAEE